MKRGALVKRKNTMLKSWNLFNKQCINEADYEYVYRNV
jgi:hypothetical protein